eukprot:8563492-Pyramimonas_sp.AAC.2
MAAPGGSDYGGYRDGAARRGPRSQVRGAHAHRGGGLGALGAGGRLRGRAVPGTHPPLAALRLLCVGLWSGVERSGVERSGAEWSGVKWNRVEWNEVE